MRFLTLALTLLVAQAEAAPHVYLVIVDGLRPAAVTLATMPLLHDRSLRPWMLRHDARAIMPTRTNPNHVTLLTGVYPAAHGITGNVYWSRAGRGSIERMDRSELIEVETLFTVASRARPACKTMGVFAKPKLGRLFAGVPGRQNAPGFLWSGDQASARDRDTASGYAVDSATMDVLIEQARVDEPDLAVVGLADVDRVGHAEGPDSVAYATAVGGADRAVRRLIDELRGQGRWDRSVVVVTADHGFAAVDPGSDHGRKAVVLAELLAEAGVRGLVVGADGGVAHVYADEPSAVDEERLARVGKLLGEFPQVGAVFTRRPTGGLLSLGAAHPDWHLDHPRVGDLLVEAAKGYAFVEGGGAEAGFLGNHGSSREIDIPLIVFGGYGALMDVPLTASAPDAAGIGATIAMLLELPRPRRTDGSSVPDELVGRVVETLVRLPSVSAQSPH